ncbi:MAG: diguanylate cyclase [Candidatus Dormibacterales bacterium]
MHVVEGMSADMDEIESAGPAHDAGGAPPPLVGRVIREQLAERLSLASEWLEGLSPEHAARILESFAHLDEQMVRLRPEEAGAEAARHPDLVGQVIRSEVSRRFGVPETALAGLDTRSSALVLSRMDEANRRIDAERAGAAAEPPAGPPEEGERRDVIGRTLRDVLASELGVAARALAAFDAPLAAATLSRMTDLKVAARAAAGAPPAESPSVKERRDVVARILRDELSRRSNVPARLMGGLDAVGGAAILHGWDATTRKLRDAEALVSTDDLTGCVRRSAGVEMVEAEIKRARRMAEGQLTLCFIDVVGLKAVNDRAGHAAGDAILRELSRALKNRLRASDVVIRWGGDEFVCVLTHADTAQARAVVEEVRNACLASNLPFDFSYGLSELGDGDTVATLVERADAALYAERRAAEGQKRTDQDSGEAQEVAAEDARHERSPEDAAPEDAAPEDAAPEDAAPEDAAPPEGSSGEETGQGAEGPPDAPRRRHRLFGRD